MIEAVQNILAVVRDTLAWVPAPLVGAGMLALAALIALSIHRTIIRLLRRLLRERHPYVRSFLTGTMSLTRLALLILALFIVLPATPFDSDVEGIIAKLLLLATIVLVGWAAFTAVNMAADLYLMRFRL